MARCPDPCPEAPLWEPPSRPHSPNDTFLECVFVNAGSLIFVKSPPDAVNRLILRFVCTSFPVVDVQTGVSVKMAVLFLPSQKHPAGTPLPASCRAGTPVAARVRGQRARGPGAPQEGGPSALRLAGGTPAPGSSLRPGPNLLFPKVTLLSSSDFWSRG